MISRRSDVERVLLAAGDEAGRTTISARLGDELILAARDTVAAYHDIEAARLRLGDAIMRLERLVGRP